MADPALKPIRVIDLSRVLAGPVCTQILGDLGADVIKIERPGHGDDTRAWGPPFLKGGDGQDTGESAYYLSANRNKRSIAIDITTPAGQDLVHELLAQADVLVENFKTGGLAQCGLSYDQLKTRYPRLIYCSITGFGQTGPLANEPGYDLMVQAMGGLMAITGDPGGAPMKTGVAVSDVMTGLYAAIGILAALQSRERTGRGQQVDLALFDCTLAALTNVAQYYLTSGHAAPRQGNAHATIVPYQAFAALDGYLVVAVGNDSQFRRFAALLGQPALAEDVRFATNSARVVHRDTLIPLIEQEMGLHPVAWWIERLRGIDIPAGPVNRVDQALETAQAQARGMTVTLPHPAATDPVRLVGSPLHLSGSPVDYRRAPPACGQDTLEILRALGKDRQAIDALIDAGIVA